MAYRHLLDPNGLPVHPIPIPAFAVYDCPAIGVSNVNSAIPSSHVPTCGEESCRYEPRAPEENHHHHLPHYPRVHYGIQPGVSITISPQMVCHTRFLKFSPHFNALLDVSLFLISDSRSQFRTEEKFSKV